MELPKRTSRFAIASIFFSVIGFFPFNIPFLPSVCGLILGLKARKELASNNRLKGEMMVNMSLVLALLGIILWGAAVGIALWGGDLGQPPP